MNITKKELVKIVAVAAIGVLVGTGGSAAVFSAAQKSGDTAETSSVSESLPEQAKQKSFKDETVYVLANADGSVKKIIVSDWLQNKAGTKTVTDKTELESIKNVKGEESYVLDPDKMQVWDAEGGDLYYQGESAKELPVDLRVSYKLDGKAVSAEEIAGKSGRVTVRFDYTNRQYRTVTIDGKQEKIYVPFVMLTGMILDNDGFKNIKVSNGKLINDGDRTIVAGFALPGLQENLALDRDALELPDFVEITADATSFSLSTTMTLASNGLWNELDTGKLDSIDGITDSLGTLTDAMGQLLDGSSALYGGLTTLLGKSKELVAGIDKLAAGAGELSAGTAALSAGLKTLVSNNESLNAGAGQVFDTLLATVSAQLSQNGITTEPLTVENYKAVLSGILTNPTDAQKTQLITAADTALEAQLAANGIPSAYYGAVKLMLAEQLRAGKTQDAAMAEIARILATDAQTVGIYAQTAATDSGKAAINALCLSLAQSNVKPAVESAIASLDSYHEFYRGVLAYTAGAESAYRGSEQVKSGADALKNGVAELQAGAGQLVPGVQQLSDGAKRLQDGLRQFNEDGIKKLTDLADGTLGSLSARIKATVDVSKSYQSFAGKADETDGTVKFIYKTDAVTAK